MRFSLGTSHPRRGRNRCSRAHRAGVATLRIEVPGNHTVEERASDITCLQSALSQPTTEDHVVPKSTGPMPSPGERRRFELSGSRKG